MEEKNPVADPDAAQKNLKVGLVSNGVAITGLLLISSALGLQKYALLALAIQWAVFLVHGLPFCSEKFYDASGSMTHLSLVVMSLLEDPLRHPRQILTSVMAVMWLTRLGSFLFNRIVVDGKDDRFTELKKSTLRFMGAWTIQALWCFLIDLPVLIVNASPAGSGMSLSLQDVFGIALWTFGFLFEVVADGQKAAFRAKPENKGRFITEGLWRYSRHPNYFGEIVMWVGVCVSCANTWTGVQWMGLLSPLFTTFLLTKVSGVPMLEKAGQKKWGHLPAYTHYMENTACIVPWQPAPLKAE